MQMSKKKHSFLIFAHDVVLLAVLDQGGKLEQETDMWPKQ